MKEENSKKQQSGKPKGDDKATPKFNFYWIYGLLALIFVGLQFTNWGSGPERIDKGELYRMLEEKDVERIDLVNREIAEVFIKAE